MAFFDNLKDKLNERTRGALGSGFSNYQERSSATPPPINTPPTAQTPPPSIPVPPTPQPQAAAPAEDNLYSSKMERLIDFALADGVLTEKEKQVLFNQARQEGIDLDEFEMVLESKLYEKQQAQLKELSASMAPPAPMAPVAPPAAPSAPSVAPKSNKYGEIRKCPRCGHVVQAFEAICPDCGHEFSGIEANSSMEKLSRMIDDINARYDEITQTRTQKTNPNSVLSILAETHNLASAQRERSDRQKDIANCIMNFPVPNTKTDLYEFIISCANNIQKVTLQTQELKITNKAWNAKAHQCYDKVRLLMKSDPATIQEIEEYLVEKGLLVEEKKGLFKRESTGKYVWKD